MTDTGPTRTKIIANVVLLYAGWFACVLGAAAGRPYIGAAIVGVIVIVHLAAIARGKREVVLMLAMTMLGALADSLQLNIGTYAFPQPALAGVLVPLWMIALWLNFSTAMNTSLRFLSRRYGLATALGAVGGPVAYYGGVRLGAFALKTDTAVGLLRIAIEWALLMPACVWIADRLRETPTPHPEQVPDA